jgi:hypothetical protein
VVSFTPRPLYSQGNSPWYTLDRRLGGPQSRSGRGGEEKVLPEKVGVLSGYTPTSSRGKPGAVHMKCVTDKLNCRKAFTYKISYIFSAIFPSTADPLSSVITPRRATAQEIITADPSLRFATNLRSNLIFLHILFLFNNGRFCLHVPAHLPLLLTQVHTLNTVPYNYCSSVGSCMNVLRLDPLPPRSFLTQEGVRTF